MIGNWDKVNHNIVYAHDNIVICGTVIDKMNDVYLVSPEAKLQEDGSWKRIEIDGHPFYHLDKVLLNDVIGYNLQSF